MPDRAGARVNRACACAHDRVAHDKHNHRPLREGAPRMRQYWLTTATLGGCLTASIALTPTGVPDNPQSPPQTPYSAAQTLLHHLSGGTVTLEWSDNPAKNCGVALSPVRQGGCYRGGNNIIVSTGMTTETTLYIVAHEYAHTAGIASECAADQFAATVTGRPHSETSYASECP